MKLPKKGKPRQWEPRKYRLGPLDAGAEEWTVLADDWVNLTEFIYELSPDFENATEIGRGARVSGEVAVSWADAIDAAIDQIVVEFYPDDLYDSGYFTRMRVTGSATPFEFSSYQISKAGLSQARGLSAPQVEKTVPIRECPDELEILQRTSGWLKQSGGFVVN